MKKLYWNIFICIFINFGETATEENEKFYAKVNQTSGNLTTLGYEIAHFNDKNAEVRNNSCK